MKDIILNELKKNKKEYISGEELSKLLNVSRTSVWNSINKLKEEGYKIESKTKKGYKLIEIPDTLLPKEIQEHINTDFVGKEILFFDTISSTNNYAKRKAEDGFGRGLVIIAENQTEGRGRLGREWVSPKGKGIYMTIMLKPEIKPEEAALMTVITAYAVYESIRKLCGVEALIKWPNDIVRNGKKLCGILTEMSAELDKINYLLVGIGINVNTETSYFLENKINTATSLKNESGKDIDRKLLVAEILNNFEKQYIPFLEKGNIKHIIDDYKRVSANIGKEVRLINSGEEHFGTVQDINDLAQLIVKMDDGEIKTISSGEVSLRHRRGYV